MKNIRTRIVQHHQPDCEARVKRVGWGSGWYLTGQSVSADSIGRYYTVRVISQLQVAQSTLGTRVLQHLYMEEAKDELVRLMQQGYEEKAPRVHYGDDDTATL